MHKNEIGSEGGPAERKNTNRKGKWRWEVES